MTKTILSTYSGFLVQILNLGAIITKETQREVVQFLRERQ